MAGRGLLKELFCFLETLPKNSCNAGFKEMNYGCYLFENSSLVTWAAANSTCSSKGAKLLALDLLPETIALSFWLKGFSYTNNYWIDAMFSSSANDYVWSWSNHSVLDFGYLKTVSTGQQYKYLSPNTSKDYEFRDSSGSMLNGYICEQISKWSFGSGPYGQFNASSSPFGAFCVS